MSANSRYALSSWFFLRALGLIYTIAFLSLLPQLHGLWGERGVAPAAPFLQAVESAMGPSAYFRLPSLFWINASNSWLLAAALVGVFCGLLVIIGLAEGWALLACYVLYLSFANIGREFMSFQWDALLLEVGFLSLFAASWSWGWSLLTAVQPHWIVRGLFMLVLFKLMFLSGVVKLSSGDPTWRNLSALSYHYWTQPLPNPLAPFLHAMPLWVHQGSAVLTFLIELTFPFLMFSARTRGIAALGFIGLSGLIILTGNYTFFNWLTIALCFWLIPDEYWQRLVDVVGFKVRTLPPIVSPHPFVTASAIALTLLSLFWCTRWALSGALENTIAPLLSPIQNFYISSPYGLFAVMTIERPEIVIEGSLDGTNWQEYEFKYKPGSLYRRPPIVAPHQPRLDWQMWFAALSSIRQNAWLQSLMVRLTENSEDVTRLLAWNPFEKEGPKFIRAKLYDYTFTSPQEILSDGQWWRRTPRGDYTPTYQRP